MRRTDWATLGGDLGGGNPEAKSLPGVGLPCLMYTKAEGTEEVDQGTVS